MIEDDEEDLSTSDSQSRPKTSQHSTVKPKGPPTFIDASTAAAEIKHPLVTASPEPIRFVPIL